MKNKELKKSVPEELNAEELNMVSGGFEVLISPSLPADAVRFSPLPSDIGTYDSSVLVVVCDKCRQAKTKDMLYSYKNKKYCHSCLMSLH